MSAYDALGPHCTCQQHISAPCTLPQRAPLTRCARDTEDCSGYKCAAFHHWIDADHDGCTTMAGVLKTGAFITPMVSGVSDECRIGGEWHSAYDNTTSTPLICLRL